MSEKLVSIAEVSRVLSCSEDAVRRWLRQGKLPHVKVGDLVRIRQTDVDAVIRFGLTDKHPRQLQEGVLNG